MIRDYHGHHQRFAIELLFPVIYSGMDTCHSTEINYIYVPRQGIQPKERIRKWRDAKLS